ncbi:hypothetical protein QO034_20025 [Sedimentitalea sp. JM2-8]|uniref:Stability determinant domain-containing protein n=1 Tax=Sedimentitalea xiamensis TaxID=3050037 RepID=A0ABT7FJQ6_9RHOB|nr:hypothetical protein [Sedimentitalea xiamensis]MDK3075371.1 hypothetical protein [Sedimentitalea xiamensis]
MPAKTPDPDAYDTWFRAKVQEALDDPRPATSQARAMEQAQVALDVTDMPEELGNLLDKGIDEHLHGRPAGPRDLPKS